MKAISIDFNYPLDIKIRGNAALTIKAQVNQMREENVVELVQVMPFCEHFQKLMHQSWDKLWSSNVTVPYVYTTFTAGAHPPHYLPSRYSVYLMLINIPIYKLSIKRHFYLN